MPKTPSVWVSNPGYYLNEHLYDSSTAYDTTLTYDGYVVGQNITNTKQPAVWNES